MNSTAPVPTYDVKRHYGELRELERNSLRSAMPFMLSDPPECSKTQGNILYMQSRYDEATDVLRRARAMFIEIGSVLGAGAFRA